MPLVSFPAESLKVKFQLNYNNKLIAKQKNEIDLHGNNLKDVYEARTFCLFEDIEKIKNSGLAKGGSLENAIVVKENKILNENGLRYRDEFMNHKILDCLGDLMLSGNRIFGHIKTSRGGHLLTNTLLREFFSNQSNWRYKTFEDENDNLQDNIYLKPIAVNA